MINWALSHTQPYISRALVFSGVLAIGALGAAAPSSAEDASAVAADTALYVQERAAQLAAQPYVEPPVVSNNQLASTYDEYRKVRFNPERARWRNSPSKFEVQLLPMGWLFKHPVKLWLVEAGERSQVTATLDDFVDGRPAAEAPDPGVAVPLSGFRINWPLNEPTKPDEVIVFQGATYFRALAAGQRYGLSMRALAIKTASQSGEEFPEFREFWIEKPEPSADSIKIHALLDSPSASGAFTFVVRPGASTTISVNASIYPRKDINEIGIAPLTSMFMIGPINRSRLSDYRPQVHDSDGLAILNSWGERIWRPLANPRQLQMSVFVDEGNRGYGLIQRERRFERYEDLEARYDLRPSVWVEPLSNFGQGSVVLVEIPTELEIHDNIVAFWRPRVPLKAASRYDYSYRLHVQNDTPTRSSGPYVHATRAGPSHFSQKANDKVLFVIDYKDGDKPLDKSEFTTRATASHGTIENISVGSNSVTGGLRVSFEFDPGASNAADLRLDLRRNANEAAPAPQNPEPWFYRWTRK
ncbi:MAG: glucan biosynthesis protein [Hyphomicrobiaceae bacterium]|nr:glucan biosynthesis protein [Hyphomicrobiaceae bacterium]